jgi:hypothetical protein
MQNAVANYSIIFLLLLFYLNRGFFITPYEIESHGNKETNSLLEWVQQLITGESSDIDEDGNSQSDCHSVKIVCNNFHQECADCLGLLNLSSKNTEKITFPNKENLYLKDFYTQIDHPPQLS